MTKGGQTVIVSDVHRNRPRAYLHRHKVHKKPEGWTRAGPSEVRMIMEKIRVLVQGEVPSGTSRQIFKIKPNSTWDNYFSGDEVIDWMGANGFGVLMTCRRDRLPKNVPNHYWHKEKTPQETRLPVWQDSITQ